MNFRKVNVQLLKDHKAGDVARAPVEVVYMKVKSYSYAPDAHTDNRNSSVSALDYEPSPRPFVTDTGTPGW